ncbi:hypothetical protein [Brevundimonas sp. A19_0]|uniref:hypothetical protein n=1 Tax=Brevundimonas sp. A19_0 TaxID=2821087 RepID=UPI001ADA29AF|nr:hypothetical protein [Brevundimonas sp. A19_0]MBO9502033.1 hypothetical protein [Brevundimonas sp. A19_0]
MQEPVRIAVIVEGGIVQNVLTLGVPVEVVVIDYDTEGAELADTILVPQAAPGGHGMGEPYRAYVSSWPADRACSVAADFVHDFLTGRQGES